MISEFLLSNYWIFLVIGLITWAVSLYIEWRIDRVEIEEKEWKRFNELIRMPVWWTSGSIAAELGRPGKLVDGYVWRYILRADYAKEIEYSPRLDPEMQTFRTIPAFRGVRRGSL